ncbi:hypothetical protein GCM10010431_08580 [Streptomyces kunmingensis]
MARGPGRLTLRGALASSSGAAPPWLTAQFPTPLANQAPPAFAPLKPLRRLRSGGWGGAPGLSANAGCGSDRERSAIVADRAVPRAPGQTSPSGD